jgi:putative spermidine/putrescine transport system ATP-binding protein
MSFDVPAGDILGIVGPSGCGKTTLFRCILGELSPHQGRIVLDGKDATAIAMERRKVGIVYQTYALFPHMSVADNVGYGLRARGVRSGERRARASHLLELVRLNDKAASFPAELSGGQQQRVALARALAVEPEVLLLDEAFAALDPTTRAEVMHEVRGIISGLGLTTLLVTHDQEEAFLFSRHVLVMNEGQVVVMGTPAEVMSHDNPFIRDFVKMILLEVGTVEGRRGTAFVALPNGHHLPISLPGIAPGDRVHVMIKKGPGSETVAVWPRHER